jgi:hypothetical protein
MRPSDTKYDALRAELILVDSSRLGGSSGDGGGTIAQIVEAARSPQGPFALYELGSRGPTLRELFEELFAALSPEQPNYPSH